jgi:hypothetical protein
MPALALNGWTVPVDKVSVGTLDPGSMSRAFSGKQRRTRTGQPKRTWQCGTKPMRYQDARALQGMLLHQGEYFSFDGTVYSSKGLTPTTTAHNAQLATGIVAFGSGSLYAADPTTNILGSTVRGVETAGNIAAFTALDGATLTQTTAQAWQGTRSLLVDTTTSGGVFGGVSCTASCSGSTAYTASVYVYSASGGGVDLILSDNVGAAQASTGEVEIPAGVWTRLTVTYTTDAAATSIIMYVTDGFVVFQLQQFYLDGFQIELGSTATAWANPTGSALALKYDVTRFFAGGIEALTLSCRGRTTKTASSVALALTNSLDSNPAIRLTRPTAALVRGRFQDDTGTATFCDGTWNPTGAFEMLSLVVRTSPGASETVAQIFLNGASVGTSTPTLPTLTALDRLHIGNVDAAQAFGGYIDEVLLLPYAASPSMLAGLHASPYAFGAMPFLRASGGVVDDDGAGYLEVVPSDVDINLLGGGGGAAGAYENNLARVGFMLTER